MRSVTDSQKASLFKKAKITRPSASTRKRILVMVCFASFLLLAICLVDVTLIYLVVKRAISVLHACWQILTSIAFYLYKVYSQLVTPGQWPDD